MKGEKIISPVLLEPITYSSGSKHIEASELIYTFVYDNEEWTALDTSRCFIIAQNKNNTILAFLRDDFNNSGTYIGKDPREGLL